MTHRCPGLRYPSLDFPASLSEQHIFNDEHAFRHLPTYRTQYHRISAVLELDRRRDLWIFELEAMNWRCRDGEYLGWPRRQVESEDCRRDGDKDVAGGALAGPVHGLAK